MIIKSFEFEKIKIFQHVQSSFGYTNTQSFWFEYDMIKGIQLLSQLLWLFPVVLFYENSRWEYQHFL